MTESKTFKALLLIISLFLCTPGCGEGAATCGPSTCEGCCDPDGDCHSGITPATCGKGGAACVDCGDDRCVDGSCSSTCGPANCAGCCDPDGVCQLGTTSDACGAGGDACQDCGSDACVDGSCEGLPPCGPDNCAGCCDAEDVCQLGITSATCGAGGADCQDCGSDACVDGSCEEVPCGPDNCDGCCDAYGECQPGSTSAACGTGGVACQDCGDHGTCDDSGDTAVCACDEGYTGAGCESCASGYQDNDGDGTCLADCATSGLDCGLHGTCDASGGAAVCICDEEYTGEQCTECAPGYHDEGGLCVQDQQCQGSTCSGHGTCDDTSGIPICTCDTGYAGDHCESCAPGYQDNDVNGTCSPDCATSGLDCGLHGTCDDSGGAAVCVCDMGYAGALCDTCAPGYQDNDVNGTCSPDCATSGLDCGLYGTCDDSGGTTVCVCDLGYAGAVCDACDTGYQDNDDDGTCLPDCSAQDCSGHGTCDDSSGAALCACDEGYAGAYCDTCAPEYEDFGSGCVLFWVSIPGGTFMMGSNSGSANEQPVHQVTVPAFEMIRTEVTVSQYQACVDGGVCTEPDQCGLYYNWGVAGREDHPVNCVDWFQSVDFCTWVGGRLPSEAEWEYAARGGGQDITYPWGDDIASCTYAVMDDGGLGCGMDRTWPVCSKTAGNTAQGLCDMAGNVWEWVQDWYHSDYNGAPVDGSAWESPSGSDRVLRGGSFDNVVSLSAAGRIHRAPSYRYDRIGCRCARDAP